MTYSEHIQEIKKRTNTALVKEDEFEYEFKNTEFAKSVIDFCIEETNVVREKYEQFNLCFGIRYCNEVNAIAKIENGSIILFNHKLINELEEIIRNRIKIYSQDSFTAISNIPLSEDELFSMYTKICTAYLFYHELAHIFQLNLKKESYQISFTEQYTYKIPFNIKNHIYELDADLFGISFGFAFFLKYKIDNHRINNPMMQLHLLTLFIGIIGSIFISFSRRNLEEIYLKENSHPNQILRISSCIEQILFCFSTNVKFNTNTGAGSPFSEIIIQRAYSMLDLIYQDLSTRKFSEIVRENFEKFEKYNDEIEKLYDNFPELTRYNSEKIYKTLAYL